MFSLLLTLFISLFSCGSINYQLDKQDDVITCGDSIPIKELGSNDEYGVQLSLFKSDFLSNDFIINFVKSLSGDSGSLNYGFSFYSDELPSPITFNCSDVILNCNNGYVSNQIISYIDTVTFSKTDASNLNVDSEPFVYAEYVLSLVNRYNVVTYSVKYGVCSPLYDDSIHELASANCIYQSVLVDRISTDFSIWCLYENSLDGNDTPFISYYYNSLIDSHFTLVNDNYNRGYNYGYQVGYNAGLETLDDYNTTASIIFNGIFEIGLLPVNVFLSIFNFEVFGINISGIVSGLLTMSVVVIIVRFLLGGKNDDK